LKVHRALGSVRLPREEASMTHGIRRALTLIAGAAAFALFTPLTAQASPGDLDGTFGGGDGMATFSLAPVSEEAGTVLATTGGRVLILGEDVAAQDVAVARLAPNGDPDTTFGGGDGLVTMHFLDNLDDWNAMVVLPGGKIEVAVDTSGVGIDKLGLGRFTPAGVADGTFGGGDGKLIIGFGSDFAAYDMVALDNGKLLISGEIFLGGGNSRFMVVRVKANGSLDNSFGGGDGFVQTEFRTGGDGAWRIAVDTHGRIVVAGWAQEGSGSYDTAVARYEPDGTPDHSFSGDGKLITQVFENDDDYAIGLGLQGDKILVGEYLSLNGAEHLGVIRYLPNGQLDPTFGGGDGEVITPNPGDDQQAVDLAIDANNRILVGGRLESATEQFLVARYGPNGKLDPVFGTSGFAASTFGSFAGAEGMSVAGNGKILVAGDVGSDTGVARFLP